MSRASFVPTNNGAAGNFGRAFKSHTERFGRPVGGQEEVRRLFDTSRSGGLSSAGDLDPGARRRHRNGRIVVLPPEKVGTAWSGAAGAAE